MRPVDSIHLAELHPREFAALRAVMAPHGGIFQQIDGFQMALSVTPPTPRRGLMLIDPSYEIKTDYSLIPRQIGQIARKWNVGSIALWYPILATMPHLAMLAELRAAHPEAVVHEVRFAPARDGHGITGSGMFILNAPWGIAAEAARLSDLFNTLKRN